jgi:hypothetical protein
MSVRFITRLAAAAACFVVASARPPAVHAQYGAGAGPAPPAGHSRFFFSPSAELELRRLWVASTAAKQERVACLGGERTDSGTQITRVLVLDVSAADSMGISATRSIETCGPPNWFGTVHTHIALRDGQRPYPRFSGADRGVMLLWWRRWQVDGTFCLLYSATDAHCEVDGIAVRQRAGPESETTY